MCIPLVWCVCVFPVLSGCQMGEIGCKLCHQRKGGMLTPARCYTVVSLV